MEDLMLYGFMGLIVFLIVTGIIVGAQNHKSYIATPRENLKPQREVSKPQRNQRAQEIWNRLNPTMYLADDETEPLPRTKAPQKAK